MPAFNRCEICGEPTERPIDMCRRRVADYHKRSGEGYEVMHGLLWAARRARWYAERRAAKNARAAVERDARRATQ